MYVMTIAASTYVC